MPAHAPSPAPGAASRGRFVLLLRRAGWREPVEIGGPVFLAIIALAMLLMLTSVAATLYNLLRDDALIALATGERQEIRAYEDRIIELRQRIDRLTTKQIVNQDTIEDRVSALVARQAELEARYLLVSDLEQRAAQAGLAAPRMPAAPTHGAGIRTPFEARFPLPPAMGGPAEPARPAPPDDPLSRFAPRALPLVPLPDSSAKPPGFDDLKMRGAIKDIVGQVDRRTRAMEQQQIATMRELAKRAEQAEARARHVIATTGLGLEMIEKAIGSRGGARISATTNRRAEMPPSALPSAEAGMGGPLLPVLDSTEAFDAHLVRADRALWRAGTSRAIVRRLPLARPLSPEHDITSTFGTRLDPFTRGLAMHSGIDFRAPTGTAVRATAPGKVVEAGYNGGYGRMVEIDHDNGISTRYAHLSSIQVSEGETIQTGEILGAVGSTGRSTGPHLHYEVRINDDAADPMRFLRASRLMAAE